MLESTQHITYERARVGILPPSSGNPRPTTVTEQFVDDHHAYTSHSPVNTELVWKSTSDLYLSISKFHGLPPHPVRFSVELKYELVSRRLPGAPWLYMLYSSGDRIFKAQHFSDKLFQFSTHSVSYSGLFHAALRQRCR